MPRPGDHLPRYVGAYPAGTDSSQRDPRDEALRSLAAALDTALQGWVRVQEQFDAELLEVREGLAELDHKIGALTQAARLQQTEWFSRRIT